jgi:3-oxoacyl-[acyl-carrier-protein] synthase I
MNDHAVIAAVGLVSAVGLSAAETAACARARVARLQESEVRDREFEPIIVGAVPDEGLPELAAGLAERKLAPREARMLQLAHAALEEALAPLATVSRRVPMLLGLPEHPAAAPIAPGTFLERLDQQYPKVIDLRHSSGAARGRAAGLMALPQALAWLAEGTHEFVLVGGVDSLVGPELLAWLDGEQRIRGETVSDGFTPGEGACFLLLATAATAERHGLRALARVRGAQRGKETGHWYADTPYLGDGLAGVFAQLFAATPPSRPVATVYASFNGERFWAREFGVARIRAAAAFDDDAAIEHPAEVFGDLGAAHGPALMALAACALHGGYRRSPCLVYASSDHADRAAALLEHAA